MCQIDLTIQYTNAEEDTLQAAEGRYREVTSPLPAWTVFTINLAAPQTPDITTNSTYEIEVRVQDINGAWSDWGGADTFEVAEQCGEGGNTNNGSPIEQTTSNSSCFKRFIGTFSAGASDSVTITFNHNTTVGSPYGVTVGGTNMSSNGQTEDFTGSVSYDTGEMANRSPTATQTISFINNTTGETSGPFDISAENTSAPC